MIDGCGFRNGVGLAYVDGGGSPKVEVKIIE
jgi:hypothetical protein